MYNNVEVNKIQEIHNLEYFSLCYKTRKIRLRVLTFNKDSSSLEFRNFELGGIIEISPGDINTKSTANKFYNSNFQSL